MSNDTTFDHPIQRGMEIWMQGYCGPIFFLKSPQLLPTNVVRNGTFGLVDTGKKKLLVTNEHVWAAFRTRKKWSHKTTLAILAGTGKPIPITFAPFAVNKELDLVTFDMDPLMVEFTDRDFYKLTKASVPKVKKGDILCGIGYVGIARQISEQGASFGYEFIGGSVSDVSGPTVTVNTTTMTRVRDSDRRKLRSRNFGGISGSPLYKFVRNGPPKMTAIVSASSMKILFLTHLSCVNKDGTISRPQ